MTITELENKIKYRKEKLAYHESQGNRERAEWNRKEIAKFENMLEELLSSQPSNPKEEPVYDNIELNPDEKIF
jgi:hypothetical protein